MIRPIAIGLVERATHMKTWDEINKHETFQCLPTPTLLGDPLHDLGPL